MPVIRDTTSVAAGATLFPLQGSQYEFLGRPAVVEFAILSDVAATAADPTASVFTGSNVLQEASALDILAPANPVETPEHFTLSDVVPAGERIGIRIVNEDTAAHVIRTVVRITFL